MALELAGLNKTAEKLEKALSNTGATSGLVDIFIFDSNYTYTTPNEAVSDLTTGYVTDTSASLLKSGNTVQLDFLPKEITIASGEYVKYYAIVSKNADYAGTPFAVNTTVNDALGTYYQYGGKFVLTQFEFEVN